MLRYFFMIILNYLASPNYHKVDIWSLLLIFGDLVWVKNVHNIIYTVQCMGTSYLPSSLSLCVAYPENPCRDSM